MKQEIIEELLRRFQDAAPDTEISVYPTASRSHAPLFVIKDKTAAAPNIDDWSINTVYPLRNNFLSLLENCSETTAIRMFFCAGNKFVFYTIWTDIFNEVPELCHVLWYGNEDYSHCVGECSDIGKVINYLTTCRRI